MAPLTWRNVDAPDLSKASQILNQSATMLGGATEGLGENLFDIRNRQRRDRSAAVLPEFAKVANEHGVAGALAKMGSMINPNDMTPELQEAMLNLRGNALAYEGSRASTTSLRDSNNRQQQTHDIGIKRDNELAATTRPMVEAMLRAQGLDGQAPAQGTPAQASGGEYPIGVPIEGSEPNTFDKYSTGVSVDPWEGRKDVQAGIFGGESGGDYNALFGYSNRAGGRYAGQKLTDMTVNQALDFSAPSGDYGQWVKGQVGRVATPMGAYQIVGSTLREAVKAGVVRPDEKFTEAVQDRVGAWIMDTQGTGAWEGYRGPQQPGSSSGSSGSGPVDLFSMIPPGTSIRPQDIFPQLVNLQDSREKTFERRDSDEDRAIEAERRANTAEDERIQKEAMAYVQTKWGSFNPENPQETLNQIYADESLSVEQKDAYANAVRNFYANNAWNFDLPTDVSTPEGVNNAAQDINAYTEYARTTSPSAQIFAAVNNTEDKRTPLDIMAGIRDTLGENYTFDPTKAVGVVNNIASEFSLDSRLVGRVAETLLKEGTGLYFGDDMKLDEAQLREKLRQTFKSGGDYQSEVELQASLEEMQTQAANYQQKIQRITQLQEFWREPGRDPEKAEVKLTELDDQLTDAVKALQDLGRRARDQRDEFDRARGVGKDREINYLPQNTSADKVDKAFQRMLQGQGSMERLLATSAESGDNLEDELANSTLGYPQVPSDIPITNAPNINPDASQLFQELQNFQRNKVVSDQLWDLNRSVEELGQGGIPDKIQDFFGYAFSKKGTAEARRAERAAQQNEFSDVRAWFREPKTQEFLRRNPNIIWLARRDPVMFYQKYSPNLK